MHTLAALSTACVVVSMCRNMLSAPIRVFTYSLSSFLCRWHVKEVYRLSAYIICSQIFLYMCRYIYFLSHTDVEIHWQIIWLHIIYVWQTINFFTCYSQIQANICCITYTLLTHFTHLFPSQGQHAHDAGPLLELGLPDVRRGVSGRAHPYMLRWGPRRQHRGHLRQLRASLRRLPEAGEGLLHAGDNTAGGCHQPGEET